MKAMPSIKRWAPLIGSAVLVLAVVLRTFGLTDVSTLLESFTGVVGLDEQSPVSGAEIAAAALAVTGIFLKINARRKAIVAEAYLADRPAEAKAAAVKEVLAPTPVAIGPAVVAPVSADVKAVQDVLRAKVD